MTSPRQIDANRRNAKLSTGPVTEEGKQRSRRNALRHGLTAETIIDVLEDSEDYAAFEMAVAADFEAASAVERELVLRLASLLWRLRRATAIESGLFKFQAAHLLQLRKARRAHRDRQKVVDALYRTAVAMPDSDEAEPTEIRPDSDRHVDQSDDLTRSYIRLCNVPTCPLDRLSRYEAALWRQAGQILFSLQFLDRRRPWTGVSLRRR